MRKLISYAVTLIAIFQGLDAFSQAVPADSKTIIGHLDNGLTYYIRPTTSNAGKADFYIVHNVGALQEEDNQNGLAHFLEHMAFNGTKHYPEKSIFPFLASEGVRFGYNINAYTSRYETVYYLTSVPMVRESFTDSVLTVIKDWSCNISCEEDALNAERGVISEEWRRRDDTRSRMAMQQNRLLYKGSKHEKRSVLGTLEVINGFKREEILDFYHRWYRPDLQAVIVTGDFDAADMEARVKRMFGDIPASVNPEPKNPFTPVAIESPLFENLCDKDFKFYAFKVFHRHGFPSKEQRSSTYWMKDMLCRQMVTCIIEERLKEAVKEKGCPVRSAVAVTNANNVEFYSTQFTITPKSEDQMEEALIFYETHLQRLLQHGFSEDEMEAARYKMVRKYKLDVEVFEDQLSTKEIADACKENFLRSYPCIYTGEKNRLMMKQLRTITADDIKQYIQTMFVDSEKIYSGTTNINKEYKIPSKERMLCIIDSVSQIKLEPKYVEYKSVDLSVQAQECKIVKSKECKEGEEWTLSNGVVVYWTPSEEVQSDTHFAIKIQYKSGYSALEQKGSATERAAISYMDRNGGLRGVGRFTMNNMAQFAGVKMIVNEDRYSFDMHLMSDRENADKAMRMAILQLTEPYFGEESTLKEYKDSRLSSLKKKAEAQIDFKKRAREAKYGNHVSVRSTEAKDIEALNMDLIKRVWDEYLRGDISIYVSSDMSRKEVQSLICKYLGALPINKEKLPKAEIFRPTYKGMNTLQETQPKTSAPKSEVEYQFLGKTKLSEKQLLCFEILDYVMSTRYVNLIREERGGTYHVSFATEWYPESEYFESRVNFQTRPEMTEMLVKDVEEELQRVVEGGVSQEEFDNAVKFLRKYRNEKQERYRNSLTHKNQRRHFMINYGINLDYDFDQVISSIKPQDIHKLARKIQKSDKMLTIYTEN